MNANMGSLTIIKKEPLNGEISMLQENYQVSIYTVKMLSAKRPTRKSATQSLGRAGTVKKKKNHRQFVETTTTTGPGKSLQRARKLKLSTKPGVFSELLGESNTVALKGRTARSVLVSSDWRG